MRAVLALLALTACAGDEPQPYRFAVAGSLVAAPAGVTFTIDGQAVTEKQLDFASFSDALGAAPVLVTATHQDALGSIEVHPGDCLDLLPPSQTLGDTLTFERLVVYIDLGEDALVLTVPQYECTDTSGNTALAIP
jgi:hypothetical protein